MGPDGMQFGMDGRLYCTVYGQQNVTVRGKDGSVTERMRLDGPCPTNLCFSLDGKSVLVTEVSKGQVERLPAPCAGERRLRHLFMAGAPDPTLAHGDFVLQVVQCGQITVTLTPPRIKSERYVPGDEGTVADANAAANANVIVFAASLEDQTITLTGGGFTSSRVVASSTADGP